MILDSAKAIEEIKEAIESFGTYNYYDKGAREVMDIDKWIRALGNSTAKDARQFLLDIKEAEYEHASRFIGTCVMYMDCQPEEWWDEFIVGLEEYY